jgi:hypothetical protein
MFDDDDTVTTTRNPFAVAAVQPAGVTTSGAMSAVGQQREVAEVQAAMMIARMNPRDMRAAMDRIINACSRPTLAKAAMYTYARGGTDIRGPSIRLAEAIAQQWGNISFGIRELEQRNGESTVEAVAWDLETNTRVAKVFQVPHVRDTKNGRKNLTDARDIYELVANMGARRLRACILGVVPGDVIEAAVAQCSSTLELEFEVTPDLLAKLLKNFEPFGVGREPIEKRIQRRLEAMVPAQAVTLHTILTSLRDGMSQPHDWFEVAPPPPDVPASVAGLNEKVAAKRAAKGAPPPANPEATPVPKGEQQLREEAQANGPTVTAAGIRIDPEKAKPAAQVPQGDAPSHAAVMDALNKASAAKDIDLLDVAGDLIGAVENPEHRTELGAEYKRMRKELAQ